MIYHLYFFLPSHYLNISHMKSIWWRVLYQKDFSITKSGGCFSWGIVICLIWCIKNIGLLFKTYDIKYQKRMILNAWKMNSFVLYVTYNFAHSHSSVFISLTMCKTVSVICKTWFKEPIIYCIVTLKTIFD